MKRVNARLVPKDRYILQKRIRIKIAKKMLDNVTEDPTLIKPIIINNKSTGGQRKQSL